MRMNIDVKTLIRQRFPKIYKLVSFSNFILFRVEYPAACGEEYYI